MTRTLRQEWEAANPKRICGSCYNAAGNMTNDSFHGYTYDAEGNITKVDNGSTATYTYNALNQREKTAVGTATTEFVFNGVPGDRSSSAGQNANGQRVSEWNAVGHAQLKGHYYWGGKPVAYYDSATHFPASGLAGYGSGCAPATATLAPVLLRARSPPCPWGDGLPI